jgi:FkbM family methyltransferase
MIPLLCLLLPLVFALRPLTYSEDPRGLPGLQRVMDLACGGRKRRALCYSTPSDRLERMLAVALRVLGDEAMVVRMVKMSRPMLILPTPSNNSIVIWSHYNSTGSASSIVAEQHEDVYGLRSRGFRAGAWAIDIGGNVGVVATQLAVLNPGLRVVTVEAVPTTYVYLRWNLIYNGVNMRDVVPLCGALSSDLAPPGAEVRMVGSMNDMGMNHEYGALGAGGEGTVLVPAVRMRDILSLYIKGGEVILLKMDCEGCEFKAVPSWPPGFVEGVEVLLGEIHDYEHDTPRSSAVSTYRRLCTGRIPPLGHCEDYLEVKYPRSRPHRWPARDPTTASPVVIFGPGAEYNVLRWSKRSGLPVHVSHLPPAAPLTLAVVAGQGLTWDVFKDLGNKPNATCVALLVGEVDLVRTFSPGEGSVQQAADRLARCIVVLDSYGLEYLDYFYPWLGPLGPLPPFYMGAGELYDHAREVAEEQGRFYRYKAFRD